MLKTWLPNYRDRLVLFNGYERHTKYPSYCRCVKADDDRVALILGGFIDSFETNGDALNVEVYSTNNVPGNEFIFEAKKTSVIQMTILTTLVSPVLQKAVGKTTPSRVCQEVSQGQKRHM